LKDRCISCGIAYPQGFHPTCDSCGGLVDVEYDLARVSLDESENPYLRFAGLLPIDVANSPVPDVRYTPTVHATRLGKYLGMHSLFLKDETVLPTRSTKDRMAAVCLPYLHERGVRAFCASSTGNSSTSFAYALPAYPDMHLYLFTAEGFAKRVQHATGPQVTHFGLRDATFVEASDVAASYARAHGIAAESGFFNPGRRDGLKLAFFEACEQVGQKIDWYVQAVSSAMGVYATWKGARELLGLGEIQQLPRLLCVQQESCAPMVHAFADGSTNIRPEHLVPRPAGIAEAILRGDPTRAYPHVRRIVLESNGGLIAVSEAEIRAARLLVEEYEGMSPCFAAAAAVAAIVRLAREDGISPEDCVLINITGGVRPDTGPSEGIEWLPRGASGWPAPAPQELAVNEPVFA
jgi:threonine synthase